MIDLSKIQNSHLLTDIFGKFPSFHDAEVHELNLFRGDLGAHSPTLRALIHVYEMTPEIDERKRYVLKNHVLVKFRFSDIYNLEISGFNHQNVLQSLDITETADSTEEEPEFEVSLTGIFGVKATFYCAAIIIESVAPYERKAD